MSSTRWGFAQKKERERKEGGKGQAFKIHLQLGLYIYIYIKCPGKLKDEICSLASRDLRQDLLKGSEVSRRRISLPCALQE